MFTSLHALAKQATLMITIAAEGDDELRVNVTPVPADTKSKAKLPTPLSLRATPAEFDADFIAALATWQAPKRSLLQQAQDATGGAQAPATALPPPAPAGESKAADKPQEKAKPGRKARDNKPASVEPESAGVQAAGEAAGAVGAAVDEALAGATGAGDDVAAAGAAAVDSPAGADVVPAPTDIVHGDAPDEAADKFTLDLF